jgi:hypothetical protein
MTPLKILFVATDVLAAPTADSVPVRVNVVSAPSHANLG